MLTFLRLVIGLPRTGKLCFGWVSIVLTGCLGLSVQWDPLYGLNCWGSLEFNSLLAFLCNRISNWKGLREDLLSWFLFPPSIFQLEVTVWKYKPKTSFVTGDASLRSTFAWWYSEQNTPVFHQNNLLALWITLPNYFLWKIKILICKTEFQLYFRLNQSRINNTSLSEERPSSEIQTGLTF